MCMASKDVLYLLLAVNFVTGTDFLKCDNITFPIELQVENCFRQPCLFSKGKNAKMFLEFEVDHDVDRLIPSVIAHLPGFSAVFPLPQKNACEGLINGECPLDEGEDITYLLELPVLSSYPKVKFIIEFTLSDERKNNIVCFKIAAEVVD